MQNSQYTADKIKELAKKKGISINKLLINCGLNKNAIYTMQSSGYFPRVEAIIKIADYLDCSVDYLLGRTDVVEVNKGDDPAK
ncbi:MAG TPA: helix-turn-helix domain-containing protein [Firmicutes bacterium]|nr:helix-turn-helix domain-containing protein [Bacillota bacterium]